jgi:hypothetical protein
MEWDLNKVSDKGAWTRGATRYAIRRLIADLGTDPAAAVPSLSGTSRHVTAGHFTSPICESPHSATSTGTADRLRGQPCFGLAQPEETGHEQHDDDETNEPDDSIHDVTPSGSHGFDAAPNAGRQPRPTWESLSLIEPTCFD